MVDADGGDIIGLGGVGHHGDVGHVALAVCKLFGKN